MNPKTLYQLCLDYVVKKKLDVTELPQSIRDDIKRQTRTLSRYPKIIRKSRYHTVVCIGKRLQFEIKGSTNVSIINGTKSLRIDI